MKRERILIILGVLTFLTPFYGLPTSYMTFVIMLYGASVVGIGYSLSKKEAGNTSSSEAS